MSLGAPFPDPLLEIPPSGLVDLRPLAGRTATQEQPHGAIPSSLFPECGFVAPGLPLSTDTRRSVVSLLLRTGPRHCRSLVFGELPSRAIAPDGLAGR